MSKSSFATFILDQLHELRVTSRRMFGGYGLYQGGVFFGIIGDDRLYFKTNETSRQPYLDAGTLPFSPNEKQTLKNYYEVPIDVIEDSETLVEWARRAISVAAE